MVTSLFKCLSCGLQRTVNATPEQLNKKVKCSQCGYISRLSCISEKTAVPQKTSAISQQLPQKFVPAVFKCSQCHFEKVSKFNTSYINRRARCPQCRSAGNISALNPYRQQQVKQSALLPAETVAQTNNQKSDLAEVKLSSIAPDEALLSEVESQSTIDENLIEALSPQKYKSLLRRYPSQGIEEIFAFFPYDKKRNESWISPFQQLATMAKPEYWNFQRDEFKKKDNNIPILINYLNFTFIRLLQQRKVSIFKDKVCFNTGLQTIAEKDIYAVFSKNRKESAEEWYFNGWVDSYDPRLDIFRTSLPSIASYAEDISDLYFDTSYDIDINIQHIVDEPNNRERLPESIRENSKLAMSVIQNEVHALKDRCMRNYKLAVPCWYPAHSKVQLLLPVHIDDRTRADLALVADKDKQSRLYRIRTALTVDMAYSNARLITRPDREWLNP